MGIVDLDLKEPYKELKALNKKLDRKQAELERHKNTILSAFIADEILQLRKEIAWALLNCGEYEKALNLYKSMSWKTQGETKYLGIGAALIEMGRIIEARQLLKKGLKRFPESYPLLVAMGNLYHGLGNYSMSLKYFEHALTFCPGHKTIMLSKANALYGLGLFEDAFPIYEYLAKNHPEEPLFITQLGYCHLQINYPEDAAKCFKAVMDSGYSNDDVYNGLYWAYYDMGLKTDAIEIAKEGIKKFPDPVLYYNLGIAYYEKEWLFEAKDIVEKGLKKFSEDNDLKELLEIIEDEIDNPDDDKKPTIPPMMRVIALSAILKKLKHKKLQHKKH